MTTEPWFDLPTMVTNIAGMITNRRGKVTTVFVECELPKELATLCRDIYGCPTVTCLRTT
jgi:hypothetical protein